MAKSDNANELLPLVDEQGNVIGSASRGECHNGSMKLHPVVHLHVFNPAGELYLQLRPRWKSIQPGMWDTAVGGHIDYGETIDEALRREAKEELGLTVFIPHKVLSYIFESSVEREYVNSYAVVTEQALAPSEETDGGRFWSVSEIKYSLNKGVFTPNFENEFRMLIEKGEISSFKNNE